MLKNRTVCQMRTVSFLYFLSFIGQSHSSTQTKTTMWFDTILPILLVLLPSCVCLDSFTLNQAIKDGDVLVSGRFALGFFSPGNSSRNRYVGVWYNQISNQTVVWIANRDNPVPDTSGVLSINGDGGLVIYGNNRSFPLWSANVTLSSPNTSIAKLLDTGNLVLLENDEDSQKLCGRALIIPLIQCFHL